MTLAALLIRLAVAAGLCLLGVAAYWGWNRLQLRRLSRGTAGHLRGLESMRAGVPGILYFTTPDCTVCITTQRPALNRLQQEMGNNVQIVEVDASAQPELANYWGVLSVPTTFIIDGGGQPRHINHGVTNQSKLRRQLDEACADAPVEEAVAAGVGPDGATEPILKGNK
jgi:thiol-disulfide isomerase/thioredoxin